MSDWIPFNGDPRDIPAFMYAGQAHRWQLVNDMVMAEQLASAKRIEQIYEAMYSRGIIEPPETEVIELDAADKAIRGE